MPVQIADTRKPGTFTHLKKDKKDIWDVTRKLEECPKDVQRMTRGCPEDIQKMSRGFPEDVQRMSRGCPEGHPEGSKGSPEEGLGMYNNAYISMSRNHNDSDLWCSCADRWYQETVNIQTVELWLRKNNSNISMASFDEKTFKGYLEDVRRMSRRCPDIYFLAKQNLVHSKLQTTNFYQQSYT